MQTKADIDEQQVLEQVEEEQIQEVPLPVSQETYDWMEANIPLWTRKLREEGVEKAFEEPSYVGGQRLSIGNSMCCIVGEMHGFSSDYTSKVDCDCDTCKGKTPCSMCARLSTEITWPQSAYKVMEYLAQHHQNCHK